MATARVRIPVLINTNGFWASGCAVKDGDDGTDFLGELMPEDSREEQERLIYVEADVPVPVIETVEGNFDGKLSTEHVAILRREIQLMVKAVDAPNAHSRAYEIEQASSIVVGELDRLRQALQSAQGENTSLRSILEDALVQLEGVEDSVSGAKDEAKADLQRDMASLRGKVQRLKQQLAERDAQWRQAIVPGTAESLVAQMCSTPEGAAAFIREKRHCHGEDIRDLRSAEEALQSIAAHDAGGGMCGGYCSCP